MSKLLYGKGDTKNIVATEPVQGKAGLVHVFYRTPNGVESEYKSYQQVIYLNNNDPIFDSFYKDTQYYQLLGNLFYNRLIKTKEYGLLSYIKKNAQDYHYPYTQSQWLMQTGETQFKGMDYDDPLRLYVDIEQLTKEGYDFPNSDRPEDKICIISMRTNRGDEYVLALNEDGLTPKSDKIIRCNTEKSLLEKFTKAVRKIDADFLTFHNGFGYDLPVIRDRCQMNEVPLALGRDQSEPRTFQTTIKFAEKADEYENFIIYGRHVIDTMFLAKQADVVLRELPSAGLKDCVKYLGRESEDRTYIEGNTITDVWYNRDEKYNRQDLLNYAFDDVRETEILDYEWGRSQFAQTQMVPLPAQDVYRYGTGNKIDLIFNRAYLGRFWSWPKPHEKRKYGGAYAGTGVHGLIKEPTIYIDIGSMYPTLGKILNIQPKQDELKLYPKLIREIEKERNHYKSLKKKYAKEKNKKLEKRYDAIQNSLKILHNTGAYGYLGSEWGAFNDYDEAERITSWGQRVTKKMLEVAQNHGAQPVKFDSVTEDTPIYIKDEIIGDIDIISIGELHSRGIAENDTLRKHKGFENLKIWTRSGWSKIKYTKKHKTDKTIYRITTRNGLAKVTEDHSLFSNGKEIKPEDLNKGDYIDEKPFEILTYKNTNINEEMAWLLGFMVSDGSASRVKRKDGGWSTNISIAKKDENKLKKAQKILSKLGIKTKLYNTTKSSGCNKLTGGYNKQDYEYIFNLIYDPYTKEKKVPKEILNAPENIIESFFEGQMDGDGHKIKNRNAYDITTKSQILALGLQYLCKKVYWKEEMLLSVRSDKQNMQKLTFHNPERSSRLNDGQIRKKEIINYDKEVYDVSTEDGTFVGGLNNIIFHNTDGALVIVPEEYRGNEETEQKLIDKVEENVNKWLEKAL